MQITTIAQINDTYDHVYLSPHLDDAALSCGGAIARHTARGARVLVVTLCTAVPPAVGPFSPFAASMHARWQLAADVAVTARLHEDTLALERLGADSYWAGLQDAIYRLPAAYDSEQALFSQPATNDPLLRQLMALFDELHARAPQAMFYAPLAVGNHVDHQLTFAATFDGGWARETAFYEDIPYVLKPQSLETRLSAVQRLFVASMLEIDATLSRKLGAIASYASQMNELFGGEAAMRAQVTAYAEALRPETGTYGERLWLLNT